MTEVKTSSGFVRGAVVDGVASFKGVPFAAPPVGERRFRAPEPPEPWDGVRDALDYGHTAPQGDYPPPIDKLLANIVNDGDDYLNLNVWTPEHAIGGDPRPVMVWIHGGAFVNGSGGIYDGTTFARDGVVMVSINYRLGVNGFLWFGEGTPNLGILDQIAALEWVRDNIRAFGGDPAKVTIFGESAGGMSTATLLAAPAARGLFSRAIVQSGGGHIAMSPGSAVKVARRYAKILGVEPNREAVAAADPKAILAAQSALAAEVSKKPFKRLWGDVAANHLPFEPVIDGTIVPGLPETAIAAGASADVSLMVGSNAHEGRLFLAPTGSAPKVPPFVPYVYARTAGAKKPAATVKAYRKRRSDESWGDLTAAFMTDAYFRAPVLRLAEGHPGTYVYEFQWESPQVPGLGSCHALEVPFVFDSLDGAKYSALTGPSAPKGLAAAMHKAWIDFAVTGDPGWPAYDHTTRSTMVFNTTSGVQSDPRPHDRRHWER